MLRAGALEEAGTATAPGRVHESRLRTPRRVDPGGQGAQRLRA
ncbi:hypothetical protein [Streptomyces sp. NPDC006334]